MDACPTCGAVTDEDDGFIKFRRPPGIPNEEMPAVVAAINADLMRTGRIYEQLAEQAEVAQTQR